MKIQRKESGGSGKTEIFEALFRRRPFPFFLTAGKAKQILRLPKGTPKIFCIFVSGCIIQILGKYLGPRKF